MKPTLKTALALALPLALAACGGGGGDSAAMDTPPPNDSNADYAGLTSTQRDNVRNFSEIMQPSFPGNTTGAYVSTKASNLVSGTISPSAAQSISGISYEFIIPDNGVSTTIPTRTHEAQTIGDIKIYRNYQEYKFVVTPSSPSYKYFMVSDSGYASSQFGIAATNDADSIIRTFYRGNVTPVAAMPASGEFSYRGQMILLPALSQGRKDHLGSIAANVNFSSKRMSVAVSAENYSSEIKAEIIGSAFAGKNGNKSIDGFFTGNTAGEMTGGYYDAPAGVVGVFGAKRQ